MATNLPAQTIYHSLPTVLSIPCSIPTAILLPVSYGRGPRYADGVGRRTRSCCRAGSCGWIVKWMILEGGIKVRLAEED
jgi:hypothetical protein